MCACAQGAGEDAVVHHCALNGSMKYLQLMHTGGEQRLPSQGPPKGGLLYQGAHARCCLGVQLHTTTTSKHNNNHGHVRA